MTDNALDAPLVEVVPTLYAVSILPTNNIDYGTYLITVEWRDDDRWAVVHHRMCLGADEDWDFEPHPSTRVDEWKASHRFDLDTALRLAKAAAPSVRVNGFSALDIWREQEASR